MQLLQNGMTLVLNGRSLVSHPHIAAPAHDLTHAPELDPDPASARTPDPARTSDPDRDPAVPPQGTSGVTITPQVPEGASPASGAADPGGTREVDALIVGAGPVGLYAAYYAGFRGLSVAVLDSLPEIGGQVSAMYPEKLIYDVAGFPAVKGRDLITRLADQAGRYDPQYVLGQEARGLDYQHGSPVITTSGGQQIKASFVVVTGGIGTFNPRPLPALAGFEDRGLAYFVPEPQQYASRDVVIVGGGDSAFDWALTLSPVARSVTMVHRRAAFRAHEGLVRQVLDLPVSVVTNAEVVAAAERDGWVEAVEVLDKRSRQTTGCQPSGSSPRSGSPPTSARCRPGTWRWPTAGWWSARRWPPTGTGSTPRATSPSTRARSG